jgi:cobalt/nickel transport system ATP-binding protein
VTTDKTEGKMEKTLLEVRNLRVRRKKLVLNNVELCVLEGEKLIITGDNGAGKTTLAEAIMGFVRAESGEIIFEGKVLKTEEDFKVLRKSVGYLFQNPDEQLFLPRVKDELSFAPKNLGMENVEEVVSKSARTFGIENLLEREVHELSGGEKRLVAFASIITTNPKLLILDEPTAFLDRKTKQKIVNYLKETEKSVILITHDTTLIRELNWKVYVLEEGSLREANCV